MREEAMPCISFPDAIFETFEREDCDSGRLVGPPAHPVTRVRRRGSYLSNLFNSVE